MITGYWQNAVIAIGAMVVVGVAATCLAQPPAVRSLRVREASEVPEPLPPVEPDEPASPSDRQVAAALLPEERSIGSLTVDIEARGEKMPADVARPHFEAQDLAVEIGLDRDMVVFWEAPATFHKPLYFEDRDLERYGYGAIPVLRPGLSGVRFLGSTVSLPYQLAAKPPYRRVYTLGQDRPGDLAPRFWHRPDLRFEPSAVCVGTVAGLIVLIP